MNLRRFFFFLLLSSAVFLAKAAHPDPAPNAGYSQAVSLFNAKDYQAALPLFQQAVRDDPGNAQAYYYLGSCQETVGDLRGEVLNYYISNKLSPDGGMRSYADKVMDNLSPEDQEWVEKQFSAWKPPAAQAAPTAVPSTITTDYSRAVSLYDAKDYQAALPLFQQVVMDNPRNARPYYYLGSCQQKAGYLRGEALNFYLSDRLEPYPALRACADKVMEKLSLEDRQWVQNRLAALERPVAGPALGQATPFGDGESRFGVRISSELATFNLADFQQDLNAANYAVQGYQAANPSYNYKFQSSYASSAAALEVNPYFTVGPDVEMGGAFAYWPSASVTFSITAGIDPNYFVHSSWEIDSFEMLYKMRWYLARTNSRNLRFFAEPALGLQPIDVHWTDGYQNTSGTPASDQVGWDAGNVAFVAGLKLGMAVNAGPNVIFSFLGGYQLASASGFQANYKDVMNPSLNGIPGSLYMFHSPTTGQSYLIFIPSDANMLSAFNENSATINYCTPLTVDLSGFRFNIDASYTF